MDKNKAKEVENKQDVCEKLDKKEKNDVKEKQTTKKGKRIRKKNPVVKSIAIATVLMMFVVMFVGNMITNSLLRQVYGTDGLYDAEVVVTKKQYDKIKKNKTVTDIEYIAVVKYSICNGAPYEDRRAGQDGVRVGHLNKMTYNLYRLEISEGRMPTNGKEIILSKYYDITDTINVGEWITLEQGKRSDKYLVVGKYEDGVRSFQYNENEHLMDEYSALTYNPFVKKVDSRVAYVGFDRSKIKGVYKELSSMGIKGENIYVNHNMTDGIDKDVINNFGPFYIMIIILVAIVILMTAIVAAVLKTSFFKVLAQHTDGKEENVKTTVKTKINNVIWIGLVIGVIASIIINLIFNLTLGRLVYTALACATNSIYGNNIWYTFIGLMYSILMVLYAKNAAVGKQVDKIALISKQLERKKLIKRILFSVILIIVTLVVADKFKSIVVKNIEPFKKESDYDIRISKYVENMAENPEEIKKGYSDELKKSYDKVKFDMKNIGVDNVTSLVVAQEKYIRISKEECMKEFYGDNKEGFAENKKAYVDRQLDEIYLEDDLYKELLKQYNLDEKKYIGVDDTPAIIINTKSSFLTGKDYKVLKESVKQLRSVKSVSTVDGVKMSYGDNIPVGDYIDEVPYDLNKKIEGGIGSTIYAIYPESAINIITYYVLDIEVKDYGKIEEKLNKWAADNDVNLVDNMENDGLYIDAPIAEYTSRVRENEERKSNMHKVVVSILAIAVLNIVLAAVRYVVKGKKRVIMLSKN